MNTTLDKFPVIDGDDSSIARKLFVVEFEKTEENMVTDKPEKEPCWFFQTTGCDRGDDCSYSHDGAKTARAPECHNWTNGYCRFGTKCRYYHAPKEVPVVDNQEDSDEEDEDDEDVETCRNGVALSNPFGVLDE